MTRSCALVLALLVPAALALSACGDDHIVYGDTSPPWVYGPSPQPVHTPRPGYVPPAGGAPYAVSGQPSAAYVGPGDPDWKPPVPPSQNGGCRQMEDTMICDGK